MLTRKQLDCYNAIKEYKAEHGIAPGYREIADILGLRSLSGVYRLIAGLEERGALYRLPGQARAIRLLDLP